MGINRRRFMSNSFSSAAGLMLGKHFIELSPKEDFLVSGSETKYKSLMEEVLRYKKIDSHIHVSYNDDSPISQLDQADRLGVNKMMISCYLRPFTKGTPDRSEEHTSELQSRGHLVCR